MEHIKIGFLLAITTSLYFVYSLSLSNNLINKEISSDKLVKNQITQTSKSLRTPADTQTSAQIETQTESEESGDFLDLFSEQYNKTNEIPLQDDDIILKVTRVKTVKRLSTSDAQIKDYYHLETNDSPKCYKSYEAEKILSEEDAQNTVANFLNLRRQREICEDRSTNTQEEVVVLKRDETKDENNNQNTEIDQLLSEIATLATGGNHQTAHERYEALRNRCSQSSDSFCKEKEMDTLKLLIENSQNLQGKKENLQMEIQKFQETKGVVSDATNKRLSNDSKKAYNNELNQLIYRETTNIDPSRVIWSRYRDQYQGQQSITIEKMLSNLPEEISSTFRHFIGEYNRLLPPRFENVSLSNDRTSKGLGCEWGNSIEGAAQCRSSSSDSNSRVERAAAEPRQTRIQNREPERTNVKRRRN